MSNELLVRNRLSSMSNDNNGNYHSNHSNHNNENSHVIGNGSSNHHGQTVIGQDFASNIPIDEFAIQSAAYKPEPRPSPIPQIMTPNMDSTRAKRRVTFKDDDEIQTISVYSSSVYSTSDTSLADIEQDEEEQEEDLDLKLPQEESTLELLHSSSPPSPSPSPSPSISPSTSISPERISKKASYDALQHRKQIRRYHQNPFGLSNPGYWYPLSPSTRSLSGSMIRHGIIPLPVLPSLEMTEQLISESIEREMALNPNLSQICSTATKPTREPSPCSSSKTSPMRINNDAVNMLITHTDDNAINEYTNEETEHGDTKEDDSIKTYSSFAESSVEGIIQHTNLVHINNERPIMQGAANSFSSNYTEDEDDGEDNEEESDTSVTTSSPQPRSNDLFNQQRHQENEDKEESDLSRSIFDELTKRNKQTMEPFCEYQSPELMFPFEQSLMPLSATDNILFIPPPPIPSQPVLINNDPVWIDCPSVVQHQPTFNTKGLFFVKVLRAENLDFPIDNDRIYCTIRHKWSESRSSNQKMAHTMTIDHEMRIENVDPNEKIAITIHVAATKTNQSSGWYHRIKPASDLGRYVHEKDRSICQTLFSPNRFMESKSLGQTASLMLVNNWYKASASKSSTANTSLLRLRKANSQKKRNLSLEKAVGKIYVQCLYVKTQGNHIPSSMEEAIEALNAHRFHQTDWQAGYMSQMGGNLECLAKRYFTLTGGCLFAYEEEFINDKPQALYKLPLSRATKLICDNLVIAEKPQYQQRKKSPTTLLSQLESVIMASDDDDDKELRDNPIEHLEESFYLMFDNGDKIQFQCESVEDRNRWVTVIEIMICKLPELPDWIIS